jgi:hypothetical protein
MPGMPDSILGRFSGLTIRFNRSHQDANVDHFRLVLL